MIPFLIVVLFLKSHHYVVLTTFIGKVLRKRFMAVTFGWRDHVWRVFYPSFRLILSNITKVGKVLTKDRIARAKNVSSQAVHLFTLSITNQNTQKTIENEEKILGTCGKQLGMLSKLFVANYFFMCTFCKINIFAGL